jgi:outer membrane lipoprotein-sorting protein
VRAKALQFLLVAMLLMTSAASGAENTKPAPAKNEDPQLKKQLEDIDARSARVKGFTADFRQEKFTSLLKKPLISTGIVRVSGSVIRWDTREPRPTVLYSDGAEIRMFYPEQKLLEIYKIDQRLGDLASSPLPRLAKLREHFAFERYDGKDFHPPKDREVLPLKLVPTEDALKQHVAEVHVLLDVQSAHILELEVVDADGAEGDRTHVTFSSFKLDTGLKADDLKLSVPAGTTVSRPLDVKGDEGPSK